MASFTPGSARVLLAGVVSILCLVLVLAIASVGTAAAPRRLAAATSTDRCSGICPPVKENLEVVGKLEVPRQFGDVVEGQIADLVGAQGLRLPELVGRAQLHRAAAPTSPTSATRPLPRRSASSPRAPGYYHGEGAHVVTAQHAAVPGRPARGQRRGLLQRRRTCPPGVDPSRRRLRPLRRHRPERTRKVLVQQRRRLLRRRRLAGSRPRPRASPTPTTPCSCGRTARAPSWSAWTTSSSHDVDIFDITDPANPEFIADIDLVELPPSRAWTSSA